MMSSSQEDLFWAAAEGLGLPPAIIATARRDPLGRAFLQQLLARSPPPRLHQPETSYLTDDPIEKFRHEMDAARAAFQAEKKRPLRSTPARPRHLVIVSMNSQRDAIVRDRAQSKGRMVTSYMGLPKAFSDKSIEQLQPIRFNEMLVTQQHKNRYLLARIVSAPILQMGVSFICEDPSGRAEYFSIYNYPLHGVETGPVLDALFPLGQAFVVKEPTFKMNQNGSNAMIRVDSPSDFAFFQPDDPLLRGIRWAHPSPAKPLPASFDFKQHGNSLLKQKKYLVAVKAYSDGLAASPPDEEKLLLHLNRAQAHLLIGNFASAFRDAFAVLAYLDADVSSPPGSLLKATLRRARALEGLWLLDEAKTVYKAVREADQSSADGKDGVKRVKKMLHESKTGEYDWQALEGARAEKGVRQVDMGDFVGPVKVVKLEKRGGGRGVVATRDIKAGKLLLVEKAVVSGKNNLVSSGKLVTAFDLRNDRMASPSDLAVLSNLVRKIFDDPTEPGDIDILEGPVCSGDVAISIILKIAYLSAAQQPNEPKRWIGGAAKLSKIVYGDDRAAFLRRFRETLCMFRLDGLLQ
ncbi:hypothetical protein JCM10207_004793 [Rhodosporidiobolus poonsookiae]